MWNGVHLGTRDRFEKKYQSDNEVKPTLRFEEQSRRECCFEMAYRGSACLIKEYIVCLVHRKEVSGGERKKEVMTVMCKAMPWIHTHRACGTRP